MKYTILGFQQDKLIKADLDVTDALILRQIKDMYSMATMEFVIENGNKYMWINYTFLSNQLPIAGSKRNLMRRIEKYSDKLLIKRLLKKSKNGKRGNFAYIAPTIELDKLQDFDLVSKCHKGYDKNDIRVMTKWHNKDSSIKDSSIKDYKDIVAYLNSKTGKTFKPTTKKTIDLVKARLNEGFTKDDFYKVIDIKVSEWKDDPKWDVYLRPETLFSGKFEGYLNQKQKKDKPKREGFIVGNAPIRREDPW